MFSIQKFFSHDAKFFDLLEASADETRGLDAPVDRPAEETAAIRIRCTSSPWPAAKTRRITEQISEELVNTFVIGLEREDIETLSYAMYRICKTIEKFAERFNLAPQRLAGRRLHAADRAHASRHRNAVGRWSACCGRCLRWKPSRR